MQAFEEFIKVLEEGILAEGKRLYLSKREKGRFLEEENLTLALDGKRVLFLKVFYGRTPYWKEWVEVFNIDPSFFSSPFEERLYELLSKHFRRIFVEYYNDKETLLALQRGTPPEETRLGRLLLRYGYRYLRDWYYPEGLMEGGCKIQGER